MAEKSLQEISASWRELYEKGLAALKRQNLDYALTIFTQILEKEPAFYECREALRVAQHKKASAGTSFLRKAFGKATSTGPLLAKAQLALRGHPLEALNIAEQILNSDPQSGMAHKLLAEAALAADLPKTAVLSLEIARKNSPKDTGLALKLGLALAAANQVSKAEAIYSELLRADPSNMDLAQALKDLSARRTMQEGGYDALADGQGSYRDILKDKGEAVALEQEHREVKTEDVAANLIRDYESRLKQEPQNLRLLRSLAELYVQNADYERALEYYQRLSAATTGADPSVDRAIMDTRMRQFEARLNSLDPQAPDHTDQAAQIRIDRDAYRLEECRQRAERYPTDLSIRFELGQLYLAAGKISEAIQEFQKAQANPHLRIQALYHLGQCFAQRHMYDLAARSLQNALKEKAVFDDEKKELHYALGCVLEKNQKAAEAIEQFKLIYEIDIGYKDVATKVDAYYASGSGR